jgi:hypothetical protein
MSTIDHSEIRIGEFTLSYLANGSLWISRDGGEGMEVGEQTIGALESAIETFWGANF